MAIAEGLRRTDWRRLALLWEELSGIGAAEAAERALAALRIGIGGKAGAVFVVRDGRPEAAAGFGDPAPAPASAEVCLAAGKPVRERQAVTAPLLAGGRILGAVRVEGLRRAGARDAAFASRVAAALSSRLAGESGKDQASGRAPAGYATPLQAVFDNIPAGILVWDKEGRFLEANARAEQILRKALNSTRGQPLHSLVKERDGFMEGITLVSRSDKPVTRQSMVINLEGDPRTIGYSGAPLPTPEGGISGFVLLFQDISRYVAT